MSKLIKKVLEYVDEFDMLPNHGLVLACVSGGADSMCMLEVLRHISYERGFSLAVLHYNHQLRGSESERDETFVMEVCEQHGIPLYSGRGNVSGTAKEYGVGVEEAGRNMRYDFFYDTADKLSAVRIVTAHTMDDNAETMLINFARGAGANGMSGIPPVRDIVVRPLLHTTRAEVMDFISERSIVYMNDSTNNLSIYTRNKVRQTIVPMMKGLNPRFNEAASTAAELFRADEDFISEIANLFISDCCIGNTANASDIAILPFSVSSRVIRKLYGGNLSFNHVKDVLALCQSDNPSASLSLPGMVVLREYERVVFNAELKANDDEFAPVYPIAGHDFIILGLGLKITCKSIVYDDSISEQETVKSFTMFLFKSIDICGKIAVRPRRKGDSVRLKGQSGTKTLKKLFIEKKIPARRRMTIPVICDDEGVLGVYGLGVSDRALPRHGDLVTQIIFEESH